MRITTFKPVAGIVAVIMLLAGCGSYSAPIPVINKSPDRTIPEAYQVIQGDSIYNISWAFGVDYLDIAEWSELKPPYSLQPGQVVYLKKPEVKSTGLASASNQAQQPVVVKKLPDKQPVRVAATAPASSPKVTFSASPEKWNWPAEGKLVGRFSPGNGSNGIQIEGISGSPVKATAAGEVVYVGEGLRGYGKLIIVKHSEQYLSAYAHNREIMVEESQAIQSGQQIATMGSSGTESTMLHFEIRKDGKPMDPMKFLN
jgi:lipoprotein NlpD